MGVARWATKLWHGSIFCPVCTKNWIRRRRRERTGQARGLMTDLLKLILGVLASLFRSRAKLEAENLVLRQQINVLRRADAEATRSEQDRSFSVRLALSLVSLRLGAVAIVRPETIIRWHRARISSVLALAIEIGRASCRE